VFLEFEGDKVVRQRNYDCFEPFWATGYWLKSIRTLVKLCFVLRSPSTTKQP
jgi:hypothetical protein